jgi:hypothetical protein
MRTALKIFGLIALLVGALIVIIFAGVIGRNAGRQTGEAVFAKKSPTEAEVVSSLVKLASSNNAKPRETVGGSRIEREEAGPGRKYTYYMTLTGYSSVETSPASTTAFATQLKQNVCARKGMGGFFKHGISVVYVYSGNDAREIGRLTITPADCGYR